jgi:4-hydroxy-3-polyprenylbenzoate decarboxylase
MSYSSLEECLLDLEKNNMLVRISEEVDPYLEMASIHLRMYEAKGPAILFEKVKGCKYRASSNIFGSIERSKFIFRKQLEAVQQIIALKQDPIAALKNPLKHFSTLRAGWFALPYKNPIQKPVLYEQIKISDLPLIHHWPKDGGAFITLPQVYTEDVEKPGVMHANMGMYRIQLNGNQYVSDKEIGLHYQLHRGIGVHQTKAHQAGKELRVSCFVGGPPSHTVAAVMPLPEGLSEAAFAGLLGGRRFRYTNKNGFCMSTDADFVLTGTVAKGDVKPEGPFGDHLGYYSLQHDFPCMRVHKVYARKNAIWPFTVVGRPPQEDTSFGALIHEITGDAIQQEIPGLKEVHAVDAAGVHPLLLAIGSERYTPYAITKRPAELLTIANHMLGSGQLSLAKYAFITADETHQLSTHTIHDYLHYIFERIDLENDLHFYTKTSIDTLDYSGDGLNTGSKLVLAAYGEKRRNLSVEIPSCIHHLQLFSNPYLCLPGVIALQCNEAFNTQTTEQQLAILDEQLKTKLEDLNGIVQIILCDDSAFVAKSLANYLWVTYTRSNPANDVFGIASFTLYKHWGCKGPMIIDARIKPHHAPILEKDPAVEKRVDRFFQKGGVLEKWG